MSGDWLVLVESNTTGSGRLFCAAARQLGLRPVVLVADPDRYRYLQLDDIEVRVLDTGDRQQLQATCATLPGRVAGVTSSSEYFVGPAGELARDLGLAHPDPTAVARCRDKAHQRVALATAGMAGPAFDTARTPAQAVDAAGRMGLPVVVKPCTGSGSIGVRRCATLPQVYAAASAVLDADPANSGIPQQHTVLVEQYLHGPEYSVETFDRQVIGITAKHLGPEPYFVEIGHDFPAPLTAEQQASLSEIALRALDALGLGWGPAHLELRLTGQGPRMVEVNPRLAGGMIPRLVHEATGIDLVELTVARVAGLATTVRRSRDRSASIRFLLSEATGTLVGAGDVDRARACPGVVEASVSGVVGQQVRPQHSFRDRLGYVICTDQNGLHAARAADLALAHLELRVEPAVPVAEGMLSQ